MRACKLTFNGNRYLVNSNGVVARVKGEDSVAGPEFRNIEFCASEESDAVLAEVRRIRKNRARRERNQILKDCGLVKVRGALGGTYWE